MTNRLHMNDGNKRSEYNVFEKKCSELPFDGLIFGEDTLPQKIINNECCG